MNLLPCPFCGEALALTVVRVGNARQSTIIECEECGCRLESPDEGEDAARSWNRRAWWPGRDAVSAPEQRKVE